MTTQKQSNDISDKNDFSVNQTTLGQKQEVESSLKALNKGKHRFAIADYAQEFYSADKLRDNLDNLSFLSDNMIDKYEANNKSGSPSFDDTAEVLALIDSFDPEHYVYWKQNERQKSQSSGSGSNDTIKSRVKELTEEVQRLSSELEVQRLSSALEAQRNLLHELNNKIE